MAKRDSTLFLMGISLILILLDYYGLLVSFKTPFEQIILPVKQTIFKSKTTVVGISDLIQSFPKLKKDIEDNKRQKKENEELTLKVRLLTEENSKLRYQLGAPLPASYQFTPAQVVVISRFMEIAVGEKEGVKQGMPVVDGATLIGKIVAVSGKRSMVMLPTDPEAVIPAKTLRGTKGVVVGYGGGIIILEKVLQKDPLILNDQVITSGEGEYPANLLIGTIVYINATDVSTYKQAKVAPALDYGKEQIVFAISSL